jgi:hypothetical protein
LDAGAFCCYKDTKKIAKMDSLKNQDLTDAEWDKKIAAMESQVLINKTRRRTNDEFNARLDKIIVGNKDYNPLELGNPCAHLLKCGIADLPIEMAIKRLVDKKLQSNHQYELLSVRNMPDYLVDPIAVFQSKTSADCKVVLTEMKENEVNFIVVIELNRTIGNRYVNSVRSVYPKQPKDILNWIIDGLMEYCNKEKVLDWMGKQQSNSADVTRLIEDTTKLVNKFVN